MGDRRFVGPAKEDIPTATVALAYFGTIGGHEFIPELRALEAKLDGTVANGQLGLDEAASVATEKGEILEPVSSRRFHLLRNECHRSRSSPTSKIRRSEF